MPEPTNEIELDHNLMLRAHAKQLRALGLSALFAHDPKRVDRYRFTVGGIDADLSKHFLNDATLDALLRWAERQSLPERMDDFFAGRVVNHSEQRPAGHHALRAAGVVPVVGTDVMPAVSEAKANCAALVSRLRSGAWSFPVDDVVHVGVGGSYWGPRLLVAALSHWVDASHRIHWSGTADGKSVEALLARLDPRRTLFVFVSKSMQTDEVLVVYRRVQSWLQAAGVPDVGSHCLAVTAAVADAQALGVPREHVLPMWSWVGGRYSVWSSVSLVAMMAMGMAPFEAFLHGAREMDAHFRQAPLRENLPVVMAILSQWYQRYFGATSHCVMAYEDALVHWMPYLQQLVMESLGKGVDQRGHAVAASGVVWWGGLGTSGEHGYAQWLHQGLQFTPVDFVVAKDGFNGPGVLQRDLLAHCFAQSAALMLGSEDASGHRAMPGNRPSSVLLLDGLRPQTLGLLLALYEHRVFAEGVLLGVNPFDQWGVALGKAWLPALRACLAGQAADKRWDPSTEALIERVCLGAAQVDSREPTATPI